MPHVTLEYSANLPQLSDFRVLFDEIHRVLNSTGGIKLENCKSRARIAEHFHIGDGNPENGFIHLNIEFVAGRTTEVKQAIGRECLALLQHHYQAQLNNALQITVNIVDISLDAYFKYPAGTLNYQ